jgi:hypothetical protein
LARLRRDRVRFTCKTCSRVWSDDARAIAEHLIRNSEAIAVGRGLDREAALMLGRAGTWIFTALEIASAPSLEEGRARARARWRAYGEHLRTSTRDPSN